MPINIIFFLPRNGGKTPLLTSWHEFSTLAHPLALLFKHLLEYAVNGNYIYIMLRYLKGNNLDQHTQTHEEVEDLEVA